MRLAKWLFGTLAVISLAVMIIGMFTIHSWLTKHGSSGWRILEYASSRPAPKVERTPKNQIVPLHGDPIAIYLSATESTHNLAWYLKQVKQKPGSVNARFELASYCSQRQYQDAAAKEVYLKTFIWFVANLPESPLLADPALGIDNNEVRTIDLAAELYESALHDQPKVAQLYKNYSVLYQFSQPERSLTMLERAVALDPKSPDRVADLAFWYSLAAKYDASRENNYLEKAEKCLSDAIRLGGRPSSDFFVKLALSRNRPELVDKLATALLASHEEFQGHSVRVQVALARGDFDTAKRELLLTRRRSETEFVSNTLRADRAYFEATHDRTTVLKHLQQLEAHGLVDPSLHISAKFKESNVLPSDDES